MPPADPCVIVILGASGDLTHRKLIPALYEMDRRGALDARLYAARPLALRPPFGDLCSARKANSFFAMANPSD